VRKSRRISRRSRSRRKRRGSGDTISEALVLSGAFFFWRLTWQSVNAVAAYTRSTLKTRPWCLTRYRIARSPAFAELNSGTHARPAMSLSANGGALRSIAASPTLIWPGARYWLVLFIDPHLRRLVMRAAFLCGIIQENECKRTSLFGHGWLHVGSE
jgi:hypothetical protein